MQTGVYRLNLHFKLYLFIYFSYVAYLFAFPLRLAALKPEGFLTEGFGNGDPPLLPLGTAPANCKRYIYHMATGVLPVVAGGCCLPASLMQGTAGHFGRNHAYVSIMLTPI